MIFLITNNVPPFQSIHPCTFTGFPRPVGKLVIVSPLNPSNCSWELGLRQRIPKCGLGGRRLPKQGLKLDFGEDILKAWVVRGGPAKVGPLPVGQSRLSGPQQPGLCACPLSQSPSVQAWHPTEVAFCLAAQSTEGRAGFAENRFAGAAGAFSSFLLPWSLIFCPSTIVVFPPSFFP